MQVSRQTGGLAYRSNPEAKPSRLYEIETGAVAAAIWMATVLAGQRWVFRSFAASLAK